MRHLFFTKLCITFFVVLALSTTGFSQSAWVSEASYSTGNKVSFESVIYEAKKSISPSYTQPKYAPNDWLVLWVDNSPWISNIYYEQGDIVLYNSVFYTAKVKITNPGCSPSDCGYEWTPQWVDYSAWVQNLSYKINNIVTYNGIAFKAKVDIVDKGASPMVNCNEWDVLWQNGNAWNAGICYKQSMIVQYAAKQYIAKQNIQDKNTSPLDNSIEWTIQWNNGDIWQTGITYQIGNVVTYNGNSYTAKKITSSNPNTCSDWEVSWTNREEWLIDICYKKDMIVLHQGKEYIAKQDIQNKSIAPLSNGQEWAMQWNNGNDWESGITYQIGNVVKYNNYFFKANVITNNQPLTNNDWGIDWGQSSWINNSPWIQFVNYNIGHIVSYNNNLFVAKQNIIQSIKNPSENCEEWQLITNLQNKYTWSSGLIVPQGAIVMNNNMSFQSIQTITCIDNNRFIAPELLPTIWRQLTNEDIITISNQWKMNSTNNGLFYDIGKVSIGMNSITPNYILSVKGGIATDRITIKTAEQWNWPDYVFSNDYSLMSLDELRMFLQKNKHLPNIPSAKEVQANGIDLGEMDAQLLRKIEELTLYILQLEKRIADLEK